MSWRVVDKEIKPVLLYDGECPFCRHVDLWWEYLTDDRIQYLPYQAGAARYPYISAEAMSQSVQLIDGPQVYQGAEAGFRSLPKNTGLGKSL